MREISLRSPFSPEECAHRLKAVTEPDRGGLYEDLNRSYAVLARLNGRKVRLRVRRPYTRNSLAPIFYGRFSATPEGTLLRGRFRMHPGILAFLVVWFTGLLVMGGWIVALNVERLGFEIVPLLLLIGTGAALVWLFRRLGRADQEDIVQIIRHTLNAEVDEAA